MNIYFVVWCQFTKDLFLSRDLYLTHIDNRVKQKRKKKNLVWIKDKFYIWSKWQMYRYAILFNLFWFVLCFHSLDFVIKTKVWKIQTEKETMKKCNLLYKNGHLLYKNGNLWKHTSNLWWRLTDNLWRQTSNLWKLTDC